MTTLGDQLQRAFGSSFVVERELSGGGMARLFVVRDEALGRRVVVKVLPHELAGGVSLERFNREIQLLARLQHPNIVPVLTAGAMDGIPYFTMPFVEGESLRSRLTRGETLTIGALVLLLKDVAAALAYAHKEGVVHRDIKPDNVLISGTQAMVTDFGVSKAVTAAGGIATSNALTSIGIVVGTPAYMSPEQAAADAVDHRADIYSFGAMAYEMMTGRAPFPDRTPQSTMAAHIHEKPVHVLRGNARVPAALAELVMRCLEKKPEARPQSGDELLLLLDSAARQGPRWVSRSRVALVTATALAIVAIVAANVQSGDTEQRPQTTPTRPAPRGTSPPSAVTTQGSTRETGSAMRAPAITTEWAVRDGGPTRRDPNPSIPDSLVVTLKVFPIRLFIGDTTPIELVGFPASGRGSGNISFAARSSDTTVMVTLPGGRIAARRAGSAWVVAALLVRGQRTGVRDSALLTVRANRPRYEPSARQPSGELARAIALYERFDVVAAMPIFRALIAAPDTPKEEKALAYAYFGATFAVLAMPDSAVRMLRRAIELDPTIDLDPAKFASSEIGAFEDARNFALVGVNAFTEQRIRPRSEQFGFRVTLVGSGMLRVALRRPGNAQQFEISRRVGAQQGVHVVNWTGTIGDSIASAGQYEVLAVIQGVFGAASDTARRVFRIAHDRDSTGVLLRIMPDSAPPRN